MHVKWKNTDFMKLTYNISVKKEYLRYIIFLPVKFRVFIIIWVLKSFCKKIRSKLN